MEGITERLCKAACPGCASRKLIYSDYAGLNCMDCGAHPTLGDAYIFGLRLADAERANATS